MCERGGRGVGSVRERGEEGRECASGGVGSE